MLRIICELIAEEEAVEAAASGDGDGERTTRRWNRKIPAGVRDFPCGWDTMVENTLDPAHFCCAHHGTLGDRCAQAPNETANALVRVVTLRHFCCAYHGTLGDRRATPDQRETANALVRVVLFVFSQTRDRKRFGKSGCSSSFLVDKEGFVFARTIYIYIYECGNYSSAVLMLP